ncbi:unnamed protein product [Citrullus colocynthis]|uniref:Uncharacterized protein n=1 Tax=Citrullus colocynthis TaxID=252529 RepID=A0ABP0XRT7_9ROSI
MTSAATVDCEVPPLLVFRRREYFFQRIPFGFSFWNSLHFPLGLVLEAFVLRIWISYYLLSETLTSWLFAVSLDKLKVFQIPHRVIMLNDVDFGALLCSCYPQKSALYFGYLLWQLKEFGINAGVLRSALSMSIRGMLDGSALARAEAKLHGLGQTQVACLFLISVDPRPFYLTHFLPDF